MAEVSTRSDGVGLLKKGFQLLACFTQSAASWSQADLARATGMTRSTTSRLVRYLCDIGYLTHVAATGRYCLGPAAIDLGRRAAGRFVLAEVARPVLDRLAEATSETVILTEYDELRRSAVCAYQIESRLDGLRVFENVGSEFRLHEGAAPRAILAALPEEECAASIAGPLPGRTPGSLTSAEAVRAVVAQTRALGYAVSREETYPGVIGVAAAIRHPDGRPAGSVAVAAPVHRMDEAVIAGLGALLSGAAAEISGLLAGDGAREALS